MKIFKLPATPVLASLGIVTAVSTTSGSLMEKQFEAEEVVEYQLPFEVICGDGYVVDVKGGDLFSGYFANNSNGITEFLIDESSSENEAFIAGATLSLKDLEVLNIEEEVKFRWVEHRPVEVMFFPRSDGVTEVYKVLKCEDEGRVVIESPKGTKRSAVAPDDAELAQLGLAE